MLAPLSPSQLYNSDPGSYSGLPSPIPTTVHVLTIFARRIQRFLPSTIRVELYLPTLLTISAVGYPFFLIYFSKYLK